MSVWASEGAGGNQGFGVEGEVMRIQGGTLLFQGDSITDAGRARPVGEGGGLGGGYSAQVHALLTACYPERKIRVLNTGVSGNRVTDLQARWQADVLDLKPDWLSVMIGTNDVWRQFDHPSMEQVLPERFESVYRALLTAVRPSLKGLILLTPFLIEPSASDPMRLRMIEYGRIVARLAHEFHGQFVDTQKLYDGVMASVDPKSLSGDRVHPSMVGHAVLTRAVLRAIDFRV